MTQVENHNKGRTIIGIIFIFVGLAFLLDQFTFIRFGWVMSLLWPIIIIYIGYKIYQKLNSKKLGLIIMLIGSLSLISNLIPGFNAWALLPALILISLGFYIIYSHTVKDTDAKNKNINNSTDTESNELDEMIVFWGAEKKVKSKNFKGGKITVIFGGADIDLRKAELSEGKAEIDITTIFGGTEIRISDEMKVVNKGSGIFGAFEDKTEKPEAADAPQLIVTGEAIFGGVEIK